MVQNHVEVAGLLEKNGCDSTWLVAGTIVPLLQISATTHAVGKMPRRGE